MPITKKKGAIFAIYADSPGPTSTPPVQSTSPTKRTTSKKSVLLIDKPSVPSGSTRKALSSLQASAVRAKATPSDKVDGADKSTSKSDTVGSTTTVKRTTSVRKPTKSASTKRQLEALSSPPLPSTSTLPSSTQPTAHPTTEKPILRFKDTTSSNNFESPLKKGRLSTPSRSMTKDKENVPPPPADSPASRTRSRTRRHANSISSLAGLGINSPVQPLSRARPQRTDSGISGQSGLSVLALAPAPDMAVLADEAVEEVKTLVGTGRGALSLKKGRALAGILGSGVDLGDDDALDLASSGVIDVETTPGSKSTKSKSRGKGFWREGDGPLVDVSEAYGAAGDAPEGFTSQGRV